MDGGFTLLEVVIATAVLSLTLVAVLPMFGEVPARLKQTATASQALQIANSRLNLVILESDWNNLPLSGTVGSFRWSVTVERLEIVEGDIGHPLKLTSSVTSVENEEIKLAQLDQIVWVRNQ